jgi:leader peptidase (prepilin peptidase) / N-methyltransferase
MPTDIDPLLFFGFFVPLCMLCGAMALIDIRHGIIPNGLNLSLATLGLIKALVGGGAIAGIEAACEGAAIGLIFWLLRRLYFTLRKTQGLGLGDVKFLAAAGPWIGVAGLPTLLLIATLTALAAAGSLQLAVAAVRPFSRIRPVAGGGRTTISRPGLTGRDQRACELPLRHRAHRHEMDLAIRLAAAGLR